VTRLLRFLRGNAIGLLALFVALGGTGYAAVKINGSQIKNGTITGKKLKTHTLTSKQINDSKLGTVPSAGFATSAGSATTASNADALGGIAPSGYLTTGCGPGRVEGYAEITGGSEIPSTYTTSSTYLPVSYSCSRQPVEVQRANTGVYIVNFPGNPAKLGFGNSIICTGPLLCISEPPELVSVTQIASGTNAGAFEVDVRNTESGAQIDDAVSILLP
jgi:hypothetical protein